MTGTTATEVRTQSVTLSRNPNFLKLWASESVSSFGAQFSELAIPFTAVLVLQASPSELGVLTAAVTAPFLIFSLIAGVWVDRHRRRSVMITSNIGRAVLLGLIPVAAAARVLSIGILLVVAFLVGVLKVFFEIAYQSFLPGLVQREKLVDANSRLEASRSVSSVAGPGVAGVVIQVITAPFAIAIDTASFVLSTVLLRSIKHQEIVQERSDQPSIISDIREGLEIVLRDPKLRSIAGASGTANFFEFAVQAIFILYTVQVLGVQPGELGIILSLGAIGALAGALIPGKLAYRIGIGPAMVTSLTLGALIWGPLIYLATPLTAAPLLITAWFFGELSFVAWSINQSSFRQAICPTKLQGRMNATLRFIAAGTVPLGSLTGGLMGEVIGLRMAIGVAAIGLMLAPIWFVFSPLRNLKQVSEADLIGYS